MEFAKKIFVLGCGAIGQCVLPLLFKHLQIKPSQVTVMDFIDHRDRISSFLNQGVHYVIHRVTQENYKETLSRYLSEGDLFIDLSWNIETASIIDWCHHRGVLYINTSVEEWESFFNEKGRDPRELTLYKRQQDLVRLTGTWKNKQGPTAIVDHGANPGLVSHFVKQGLIDIAEAVLLKKKEKGPRELLIQQALTNRNYPHLASLLGVKTIHISERDTQIVNRPKEVNEFVNTWSIPGLIEEGIAPAELGWGTHERGLPVGAMAHSEGPKNQICLSQKGISTWVQSWVPSGPITGMVIRHGEAYGISEALTYKEHDRVVYRPTVHYAYCPCDGAINSLHEMEMRGMVPQEKQRLLTEEIIKGKDEMGCLLMGHDLGAWWIGSVLSIEESRKLVPGQSATTVQVAIGVVAAVMYAIRHPNEGYCLPDDLNHEEILAVAKPYLGEFVSRQSDWSPLDAIKQLLPYNEEPPSVEDEWQFTTFLVSPRLTADVRNGILAN